MHGELPNVTTSDHQRKRDMELLLTMAIPVVEFSRERYIIRKVFG
jgi:hypothetical protein